ncbi:hypothetical protein CISG_07484 [Coccidioides immitis RMSCC 3703]|uniref:Uncharacterized protein n=1 Tax=Coccidioides immitis RMSCC 3703 TaxID=454286 RepID=A0A0J8R2C4_COCIT|nr:hypothetical protein CISG_07484 [Coccidioides immitis RMSCC 3703]
MQIFKELSVVLKAVDLNPTRCKGYVRRGFDGTSEMASEDVKKRQFSDVKRSLSLHHPSSEYGQVCFSLNGGLLLNSNWFACQTSQKTRIHLQPISELAFSLPAALYRPPSSFPCNAEYVMAENQTTDFAATDIPLNSLPHPQLARPGRDPDRSLQQDLENGIGDRTCEDRILPNGYRRSQEMSPDDELEGRNREEVIPHQILPWMRRPGRSTEHLRKCGAIRWLTTQRAKPLNEPNSFQCSTLQIY